MVCLWYDMLFWSNFSWATSQNYSSMGKRCSKCVFFCICTRRLSLDFFSLFPILFFFPSDFIMHYLYLSVSSLHLDVFLWSSPLHVGTPGLHKDLPSSGSTKKWLIYSDCIVSVSVICTKVINCAYLCIPMSLILFTVFSVWPILIPKIFLFT
jgi:hypothetical protein